MQPISDHYNKVWLRTEYNTAVIRAQRAAEFEKFRHEARILPNVKWKRTSALNPGADHAPYWQLPVILPVNDPFWQQHHPGDRWNCKCGWINTDEDIKRFPETPKSAKTQPQPGLENNPADDGELFSDKHPYQANAEPGAKKAVDKFLKSEFISTEIKTVKTFKNGGKYSEYASVDKAKSDYKLVKSIGIEFARLGKKTTATPVTHFKSAEYAKIYASLKDTKYWRKCPDLLIDGVFYEVESYSPPFKKTKINGMLSKGLKQSPYLIINNTKGAADRILYNTTK